MESLAIATCEIYDPVTGAHHTLQQIMSSLR